MKAAYETEEQGHGLRSRRLQSFVRAAVKEKSAEKLQVYSNILRLQMQHRKNPFSIKKMSIAVSVRASWTSEACVWSSISLLLPPVPSPGECRRKRAES